MQASLDFATDSGWYIGAWASNVDFGDGVDVDYEVDLYTGLHGTAEAGSAGMSASCTTPIRTNRT